MLIIQLRLLKLVTLVFIYGYVWYDHYLNILKLILLVKWLIGYHWGWADLIDILVYKLIILVSC
jgi:hypothetical protein